MSITPEAMQYALRSCKDSSLDTFLKKTHPTCKQSPLPYVLQTAYVLVLRLTQQTAAIQVELKAQFFKRACTEGALEILLSLFDIPEGKDANKLE